MSGLQRPKTAGASMKEAAAAAICSDQLPTATVGRLPRRSGSQMSLRGADDQSCWPQYVPLRRVPSAMKRNMEIQTELNQQPISDQTPGGQASSSSSTQPISGAAVFFPYYVPGGLQAGPAGSEQPFVLLSPWQLPGYQNLPVLDPSQLRILDPMMKRPSTSRPAVDGPMYRSGRNGSCWRHIRQCTGNLGQNIMFIDGHVKEEDCRKFPPHGYPSCTGLSVHNRLAPKSQPRIAAGIPLGFPWDSPGIPLGFPASGAKQQSPYQTQALDRAKSGVKYWYEERKPMTLVPNTIQGRIMKNGSAY